VGHAVDLIGSVWLLLLSESILTLLRRRIFVGGRPGEAPESREATLRGKSD